MTAATVRLALAGDFMLARGVGADLAAGRRRQLVDPELHAMLTGADLAVANLECCIVADPLGARAGGFCAPPAAAEAVAASGIGCVSLANNHAGDAGHRGVTETVARLAAAGVRTVGDASGTGDDPRLRGRDQPEPEPGQGDATVLSIGGFRLGLLAFTDHCSIPAGTGAPPVSLVGLTGGCPEQLLRQVEQLRRSADAVLVFPHWGPNWGPEPTPAVVTAAAQLLDAGATLVAGHSAHIFHGARGTAIHDLGGLHDDYPVHPLLRNDIGVLCLVELDPRGVRSVRLLPVVQRDGLTRPAGRADHRWARDRLEDLGAATGTGIADHGGHLSLIGHATASAATPPEPAPAEVPGWWT